MSSLARRRRHMAIMIGLAALAGALAVLRYAIDRDPIDGLGLAWPDPAWAGFRLHAIAAASIVGAALGISGLLLQTLLRNPLASPYILGLSSGAGLGVAVAAYASIQGWIAVDGLPIDTFAALLGACGVLMLVYMLGQRRGWIDPLTLVLVGVVVSALCGAGIMLLEFMSPAGVIQDIRHWMFGRIPQTGSTFGLLGGGSVVLLAVIVTMSMNRALDASMLSDDEARTIGVNLGPMRLAMFLLAGLLTALAVAIAGPIGFVGIIAPHAARLLVGHRHGPLTPATALCGVVLLLGAECARQAIALPAGRPPVGILTAFLGGPMFIWLLRSRRGEW